MLDVLLLLCYNSSITYMLYFVNNRFLLGGENMISGNEVKVFIKRNGLKPWQVGAALRMNDGNFSRRLRKPFTKSEFNYIEKIVENIPATKE